MQGIKFPEMNVLQYYNIILKFMKNQLFLDTVFLKNCSFCTFTGWLKIVRQRLSGIYMYAINGGIEYAHRYGMFL